MHIIIYRIMVRKRKRRSVLDEYYSINLNLDSRVDYAEKVIYLPRYKTCKTHQGKLPKQYVRDLSIFCIYGCSKKYRTNAMKP